jgi:hypothetical protein
MNGSDERVDADDVNIVTWWNTVYDHTEVTMRYGTANGVPNNSQPVPNQISYAFAFDVTVQQE